MVSVFSDSIIATCNFPSHRMSTPKKKGTVEKGMILFFMESTPVYFVYEKLKREPAASFSESEFACKVKWNNPKYAKDLNVDGYK